MKTEAWNKTEFVKKTKTENENQCACKPHNHIRENSKPGLFICLAKLQCISKALDNLFV